MSMCNVLRKTKDLELVVFVWSAGPETSQSLGEVAFRRFDNSSLTHADRFCSYLRTRIDLQKIVQQAEPFCPVTST